jgi:hypothetical protein
MMSARVVRACTHMLHSWSSLRHTIFTTVVKFIERTSHVEQIKRITSLTLGSTAVYSLGSKHLRTCFS